MNESGQFERVLESAIESLVKEYGNPRNVAFSREQGGFVLTGDLGTADAVLNFTSGVRGMVRDWLAIKAIK